MITAEVMAYVKDMLGQSPKLPQGIARFTWGLVPSTCQMVDVPVEKASPILSATGSAFRAEDVRTSQIFLVHKIPLTGVPNVKQLRFGFDPEAEIVAYCVE